MTRLALVMIARDEAPRIARALASARPHVDRMIVLDTGSNDDTAAVAAGCGAEVHDFVWCDDFSAARNAALARSDADWNLILDADEWLEPPAAGLDARTLSPAPARLFIGQAQVMSQIEQDGAATLVRSWIPRVLPRGVTYHGRIHEQPASKLETRRLPVRIGHDGYLPESLARKADRNEVLLLREMQAKPEDAYLWFQLGKEHQARRRWAQSADCFVKALALRPPPGAPYRHALVVRAITVLKMADRLEEAIALGDEELPNWQQSPDFFFVIGDLYLEWASRHPERAVKDFLPVVEYAWKRCLEIGERDDLDGAVHGRGSHMAAHNLAVMFGTVGLKDLADKYQSMAERLREAA
ncbi:MAG TPA: glycosyltransferase family 2 protein [Caulobacteraceae bacterium]|jgi:glycosyltransferase involved in cell wall biosynthesis|nr:glycosyltransferase family 2 protein [Caulobacteraceae bacterium]